MQNKRVHYGPFLQSYLAQRRLSPGSLVSITTEDGRQLHAQLLWPARDQEDVFLSLQHPMGMPWGLSVATIEHIEERGFRALPEEPLSEAPRPGVPSLSSPSSTTPHTQSTSLRPSTSPERLAPTAPFTSNAPNADSVAFLDLGLTRTREEAQTLRHALATSFAPVEFYDATRWTPPLGPEAWQSVASQVADLKQKNPSLRGFVVGHPPEGITYTATALAFMLRQWTCPVVFVRLPPQTRRLSARGLATIQAACHVARLLDFCEVVLCNPLEPQDTLPPQCKSSLRTSSLSPLLPKDERAQSDERTQETRREHQAPFGNAHWLLRATRSRLQHATRGGGLDSPGQTPLGILVGERFHLLRPDLALLPYGETTEVIPTFAPQTQLIHLVPGMTPLLLRACLEASCPGLILAGLDDGLLPDSLLPALEEAKRRGIFVGMTTQSLAGQVQTRTYAQRERLTQLGIVPLEDMLPEVAWCKLAWLLPQKLPRHTLIHRMQTPLAGELLHRRS